MVAGSSVCRRDEIGTAQRGNAYSDARLRGRNSSSASNRSEDDGQRVRATKSPRPYCEPGQFDASAKPADRQQLQHFASPNFGNFLAPRT